MQPVLHEICQSKRVITALLQDVDPAIMTTNHRVCVGVSQGDPPVGEDGGLLLSQVQVEAGIAQVGDWQRIWLPLQCGIKDLPCRHLCSRPVCLLDWSMLLPPCRDKCVG